MLAAALTALLAAAACSSAAPRSGPSASAIPASPSSVHRAGHAVGAGC
jgi:hypothetical protein